MAAPASCAVKAHGSSRSATRLRVLVPPQTRNRRLAFEFCARCQGNGKLSVATIGCGRGRRWTASCAARSWSKSTGQLVGHVGVSPVCNLWMVSIMVYRKKHQLPPCSFGLPQILARSGTDKPRCQMHSTNGAWRVLKRGT